MLITEINPIENVGVDILEKENPEKIIDEVVELPLRRACKIFAKKGIETLMSSANKKNVLKKGEEPVEKEDIDRKNRIIGLEPPNFEEAGKGYAWIMISFESLSDENKDLLFELEKRKGANGENIGEKAIWFVFPCQRGDVEFGLQVGKYNYELLKQILPEDEIPKNIQFNPKLAEFYKRHTILGYNWRNLSNGNSFFTNAY